ncbi:neuropeptides B/W receptor type 1-like [Rhopilema esculentum]|uniref:neuropeptides B/W receptor type 1-like n=1 Tax=Rhopilema esculentum TaxID=499914 RepID=UPI0031CFA2AD
MNRSCPGEPYFCPSLWPLDMPSPHLITWSFFTALLSPITIVSNAALIYGLYKMEQLNTITNKFILVLNLSDLGFGIFILPSIAAMAALKGMYRNCVVELVIQYCAFLLAYFSFFMFMCVSMDRYLHVTKLKKYNKFMNEFRMKVIVVFSFITSAIIAYISIAFPSFPLQVVLNLSDLFGILFMFILYSMVFRRIATHAEKIKKMLRDAGENSGNRETRREISATKTIRFVLGALLVLYLPYNICSAIWTYYKYQEKRNPPLIINALEYWSYIIVFFNASVNAILFAYGNSIVRRILIGCIFRSQIAPKSAVSDVTKTSKIASKF